MKKLIVIGGGFSGAYIARKLEREFAVTLIDTKDYFEFTPSVLRTIVKPKHLGKIQVLHTQYLKKASFIREKVIDIKETYVVTKKGRVDFDYLAISTGSKYNTPIKSTNLLFAGRGIELRNYAQKLAGAKKVLVIGGGIVGVELAAEIIEGYKDKEVVLVHSKEELVERMPLKARDYAKRFLEKKGVKIIFGERVVDHKRGVYVTRDGLKLKADVVFLCTGILPNYLLMEKTCTTTLSSKRYICVNKYLQVQGRKNVFAAGDITNIREEKTAQHAEAQAKTVVMNICAIDRGRELVPYVSEQRPMLVSLGKRDGMLVKGDFVLRGIIPAVLKWFVEWKTMRKLR
jgi:apoptosis-inducing factor 2